MERTRSVISLGSDLALSSQCCPRECFFNSHQALRKHCKPGWNASSGLVGGAMKNMCSFLHTMTEIPYKLNKQLLFSHMTHNQLGESLVSGKLWPWATRSDNCQTQKWKTDVAEDESTGLLTAEVVPGRVQTQETTGSQNAGTAVGHSCLKMKLRLSH